MFVRLLTLSVTAALMLGACATSQENPNYKYSTKYKAASPYGTTTTSSQPTVQSSTYVQTQSAAPVTYQSSPYQTSQYQTVQTSPVSYTRTNHECLRKEKNRELLGGAAGGTLGAVIGNKTIGGTKGTVIGAAIGGTAGYGIGDKSINCDPVVVQASQPMTTQQYQTAPTQYYQSSAPVVSQPQPVQTYQPQQQQPVYAAPTDQAYGDTYGTPGYHAVMAAQGGAVPVQQVQQQPIAQHPMPQQQMVAQTYQQPQAYQTVPVPQPMTTQTYGQPQMAIAAPVGTAPQTMYGNGQVAYHEVVEGDTVYGLSKRQCVGVEDIQRINGIDGTFNIRLGDYIQLPASRC